MKRSNSAHSKGSAWRASTAKRTLGSHRWSVLSCSFTLALGGCSSEGASGVNGPSVGSSGSRNSAEAGSLGFSGSRGTTAGAGNSGPGAGSSGANSGGAPPGGNAGAAPANAGGAGAGGFDGAISGGQGGSAGAMPGSAGSAGAPVLGGGNPTSTGLDRHDALYCGEWQLTTKPGDTIYLVRGGKVVWTHSLSSPGSDEFGDCTMMSNGHVLFDLKNTGAQEIVPDLQTGKDGPIVWRYNQDAGGEVHSVQPIGLDKVLVMQNGNNAVHPKLLLITRKRRQCALPQLRAWRRRGIQTSELALTCSRAMCGC